MRLPSVHWKPSHLSFYNIRVVDEDWKAFFGTDALPEPTAHTIILSELEPLLETLSNINVPPQIWTLMLGLRISPFIHGAPSALWSYASLRGFLYDLLYYFLPTELRQTYLLVVFVGLVYVFQGREVVAHVTTSGLDIYHRTHLVAEGQLSTAFSPELEAKLVGHTIAAYAHNECIRRDAGFPPRERDEFGGMTFRGLAPTFYKMTITQELSQAVAAEAGPPSGLHETIVRRCVPPTDDLERYWREGMWPLDNRRAVLQRMDLFKEYVAELYASEQHPGLQRHERACG